MPVPKNLEKSLVLVVGAGASSEVKLPVGAELKASIARALDIRYEHGYKQISGDSLVTDALKRHVAKETPNRIDINPYLRAGWRIRDAMPQAISIDNFIDSHRSDESIAFCGKLAIARCILDAESKSTLYVNRRNGRDQLDFSTLNGTWFNSFFQLLTENCQKDDLPERLSKVAIVCFNYDRCIEHYLHLAFQNYYGMQADESAELVSKLEIHHPYGTVGKLPWQHAGGGIDFGSSAHPDQLLSLAAELKTFTEGIDPNTSEIYAIRSAIKDAKKIAFLGFAFHRLNIDLLLPALLEGEKARDTFIYATAFKISSADIQVIREELCTQAGFDGSKVLIRSDLLCSQLFSDFWRSLSIR